MPLFFLLDERKEQAHRRGQILFDIGGDYAANRGAWLQRFELVIKRGQDDNDRGANLVERVLQFVGRVEGVDGRNDSPCLPGPQLGDNRLW